MAQPLFEIDPTSDIPLWAQLRQRFIYLINSEYFKPGDQLPSVRALAAEISINYNTVSKAYMSLERDGYISTTPRRGAFVNDFDESCRDDNPAEALTEEYVKSCLEEGLSFSDIKLQLARTLQRMSRESDTKAGDVADL